MLKLKRTRLGPFPIEECVKPEDLRKKDIKSLEDVLESTGLRTIHIRKEFTEKVINGMPLEEAWIKKQDNDIKKGETVGIFLGKNIIALGIFKKRKIAKVDRIFKFNQ